MHDGTCRNARARSAVHFDSGLSLQNFKDLLYCSSRRKLRRFKSRAIPNSPISQHAPLIMTSQVIGQHQQTKVSDRSDSVTSICFCFHNVYEPKLGSFVYSFLANSTFRTKQRVLVEKNFLWAPAGHIAQLIFHVLLLATELQCWQNISAHLDCSGVHVCCTSNMKQPLSFLIVCVFFGTGSVASSLATLTAR